MNDAFPHQYSLYGLTLRSNRTVDALVDGVHRGVVTELDFAGLTADHGDASAPFFDNGFETLWHRADGSWLLRYAVAEGAWSIAFASDASRMTIRWSDDWIVDDIASVLQGPAIAAALHLRGIPILHASVMAVHGGAIALMGMPGAGKSTTAAAMVRHGHAMLSDDLAALAIERDNVHVQPGYPRLRLSAESAAATGFGDSLPRVFRAPLLGDKRYVALSAAEGSFCATPLPLRAICMLQPRRSGGGAPRVAEVEPKRAIPLLVDNIYSGRFLDRARRAAAIQACARVAALVPVRTVEASDDLSGLPELVKALAG
jgi:hypothetical protein